VIWKAMPLELVPPTASEIEAAKKASSSITAAGWDLLMNLLGIRFIPVEE